MTDRREVIELIEWVNENTDYAASAEYDKGGRIDSVFYRGPMAMLDMSPLAFAEMVRAKRAA